MGRRARHRHSDRSGGVAAPGISGTIVAGALAAAIAWGVPAAWPAPPGPAASPPDGTLRDASPVALRTGQTCSSLLEHYRRTALREVTAWGLGGGRMPGGPVAMMAGAALDAAEAAPQGRSVPAPAGTEWTRSQTGTTVQVAGVDEADLAKRSGDLLLVVRPGMDRALHVLRTRGGTADHLGRLTLPGWPSTLLVEGDTVLVIGTDSPTAVPGAPPEALDGRTTLLPEYLQATRLDQVDISDPTRPRLVSSLVVDAGLDGARLVDGVARLVLTSRPSVTFPVPPDSRLDEQSLIERNRQVVADSTIGDWLPRGRYSDPSGQAESVPLVGCNDVAIPASPAGVSTLTLLSVDLRGAGLATRATSAVVAAGGTVYADAEQTVVTTPQPGSTAVHLFTRREDKDIALVYRASGEVTGSVLNQFSIDVHQGYLRVATTREPTDVPMPAPVPPQPFDAETLPDLPPTRPTTPDTPETPVVPVSSQSTVTVLRPSGARLVEVGRLDGLGRGERIHAVRFLGERAYVVTFRRTDPLYVVDLSVPARPRLAGELKIPGYSAYLHPAGPGRLLGLGQDADLDGRVRGLQLSLFDVSDSAAPQRVSQLALRDAFSDAETDHHAFTQVGPLVLVPFRGPRGEGLLVVRLDGERLTGPTVLPGRQPLRTFVDDAHIWSVGDDGVTGYRADTLARTGFTPVDGVAGR